MKINKKEFTEMKKELNKKEEKREKLIGKSRKLLTIAKKTIYETHRNNLKEAEKKIREGKKIASELIKHYKTKEKIGAVTAALQEWAESLAYHEYVKKERLITKKETKLETEDYLLAIIDMTGELVRKATLESINNNYEEIKKIRDFIEEIYGEYADFDFRNGELRKKTDQLRWNLQKTEELMLRTKK